MLFKNILVPIDFSEASKSALRLAIRVAQSTNGAHLTLLHIGVSPTVAWADMGHYGMTIPETLVKLHEQMAKEQEHLLTKLAKEEIPESLPWTAALREGFPPEEVAAQVETGGHDLIVMGTHGRTGLTRVLLGSVAERVLRDAKVPVLVTR